MSKYEQRLLDACWQGPVASLLGDETLQLSRDLLAFKAS